MSVLLLSVVFLQGSPPTWVLGAGAGAGAGAAVAAVALRAGWDILRPGFRRATGSYRVRFIAYAVIAAAATITVGPYVVLALLALGLTEIAWRFGTGGNVASVGLLPIAGAAMASGGFEALSWTALKVGALSYGGGFVIIPLMQTDAVDVNHWMTEAQFLNAVALGQITPGPVVATIVAVGFAAHGVGGALLAGAIAFAPSFLFVLLGAERFEVLRANAGVRAFLDGAAPAAAGAIVGAAVPLAGAITEEWQVFVTIGAVVALLLARRGVVSTLLLAGATGTIVALAGGPVA